MWYLDDMGQIKVLWQTDWWKVEKVFMSPAFAKHSGHTKVQGIIIQAVSKFVIQSYLKENNS